MMPKLSTDLSEVRVSIGDKTIGASCKHCGNQVLSGDDFCSWEHYEYWYHAEQQRLFGQANR